MTTPADLESHTEAWSEQRQAWARTAGDGVADQLRDLIHRGDLSPGDRLPSERRLCDMLKVGRLAVREGLATLRAQGYVEVRRGQHGGSFVTELVVPYRDWWIKMSQQPALLYDIMELREAVETAIARLAAARRTDTDLRHLQQAVDSARDCSDAGVFRQADSAFHAALARAARNDRLFTAMLSCRGDLFVPANTEMVTKEGMSDTHRQHTRVLDAVEAGDGDAAALAMTDHLRHATRDIQGSLDTFDPLASPYGLPVAAELQEASSSSLRLHVPARGTRK